MKSHDTLFRTMCAHQDIQQDLVRLALPELADSIRMDTVRAMQDTFTEGAQADLLLAVEGANGTPHLVYILVEHKSYPDRTVALQLFGYVNSIWRRWLQDPERGSRGSVHHAGTLRRSAARHRNAPLPRIHPVVLYHGRRRWTAPTRLSALHTPGGRRWAELEYRLVDLSVVEPREYRIGARALAFFIILKHTLRIMNREAARTVLEALSAQELDGNTRELLVEYLTQNTPKQNTPVLLETTHEMQYHTEGGQTVMTMAEALLKEGEEKGHAHGLKEGMQKGLRKGLEKGRREGRGEGVKSVARTMFAKGLPVELIVDTTGLTTEEIQALQTSKVPGTEPQED